MLYETKILDAYGNLKKIISGKELQRRHWENYKTLEKRCNSFTKNQWKGKSRNDTRKKNYNLNNIGDETY